MRSKAIERHALPILFVSLSLFASVPAGNARAETVWTQQKCIFYENAFDQILSEVGQKGISERFVGENRAFIKAGCSNGTDICPASDNEFEVANRLSIAAVNFGTTGSFLPFLCRTR